MTKPPDIHTPTASTIHSKYSSLDNPKYMVITRKDNKSFENVSPFLIKKSIDYICAGEVATCKKTRAGSLLVRTKNFLQSTKLLKLKNMADIEVTVTEHKTLNLSKGVIYCNELRNIETEEILTELKPQKVTGVQKILKKQGNSTVETGLIIITFYSHDLPESLNIGYEKIRVRPYIPLPLRCKKCLRFGHPTPACKSPDESCLNCSGKKHTMEDEICNNTKNCLNCKNNPENDAKHSPLDRKCPAFLKQQELTAIKTTEKVDHKAALAIYYTRHNQQLTNSFARTLTNTSPHTPSTNTSTSNTTTANTTETSPSTSRHRSSVTSYQDLSTPTHLHTTITNSNPENMDLDLDTNSRELACKKTDDLKLRLFLKEKNNTLTTNLKASKPNLTKTKHNKQKNIKNNSDSESI